MKQAGFICAAALFISACGGEPAEPVTDEAVVEPEGASDLDTVDATEAEMDPIAGGPCTYDVAMVEAHVVVIEDDLVEMNDSSANPFYLDLSDFDTPPQAGDDFTIKRETITSGTCTPEIYTIMEGDVGGVE